MSDKIEYADLTSDQQSRLLYHSANLLREITTIWGAEQGMLLWEKVAEGLGQDLKGALFFSMITGDYLGDITVKRLNAQADAIQIIKVIRAATKIGLKEAKDMYDTVKNGKPITITISPEVDNSERMEILRLLESAGCVIK